MKEVRGKKSVVRQHGEGEKNMKRGKDCEGVSFEGGGVEGEKTVRVGQFEVCVTGEGVKNKGSVRELVVRKVTEEEKGKGVRVFEVDEDGGVRVIGVEEEQRRRYEGGVQREKPVVRVPS